MAIYPCSTMRVAQLKENIAINNKHFLENNMTTYDLNEMKTKLNKLRAERDSLSTDANGRSILPINAFEECYGIYQSEASSVIKYLNSKIEDIETDIKNQLGL